MYIGFIIIVPERGVYIGHGLGLGFWSKLETAGQDHAVTFPSPSAARTHMATWLDGPPASTQIKHIRTAIKGRASIAECQAVGVEPWTP